jgi:hypothetical protein
MKALIFGFGKALHIMVVKVMSFWKERLCHGSEGSRRGGGTTVFIFVIERARTN